MIITEGERFIGVIYWSHGHNKNHVTSAFYLIAFLIRSLVCWSQKVYMFDTISFYQVFLWHLIY